MYTRQRQGCMSTRGERTGFHVKSLSHLLLSEAPYFQGLEALEDDVNRHVCPSAPYPS